MATEKKDKHSYVPIQEAMSTSFEMWKRKAMKNNPKHITLMQDCFDFLLRIDKHLASNECGEGAECYEGGIIMATLSTAMLAATADDLFTKEALRKATMDAAQQIVAISKNGPMVRALIKALMTGKMDISAVPLGNLHKHDWDRMVSEMDLFDDFPPSPEDQPPCPDCGEKHPTKDQVLAFLQAKLGVH